MHKQGEIVLLPFPFSDLSDLKKRPVVIISNDKYNSSSNDVIVLAVTSNITVKSNGITLSQKDMGTGVLIKPSKIRTDKIFTISKQLIIKTFGKIKPEVIEKIKKDMMKLY